MVCVSQRENEMEREIQKVREAEKERERVMAVNPIPSADPGAPSGSTLPREGSPRGEEWGSKSPSSRSSAPLTCLITYGWPRRFRRTNKAICRESQLLPGPHSHTGTHTHTHTHTHTFISKHSSTPHYLNPCY